MAEYGPPGVGLQTNVDRLIKSEMPGIKTKVDEHNERLTGKPSVATEVSAKALPWEVFLQRHPKYDAICKGGSKYITATEAHTGLQDGLFY